MLATQVRQKDAVFYFVAYPAEDLLQKVRFISRYYDRHEHIPAERIPEGDEIAAFIASIERRDTAFQRELSRAKIRSIKNFYETAVQQPPIPATVLLFTSEHLAFTPVAPFESVGDLAEPQEKYLIIDGQHRLAALEFYMREHPDEARTIAVPCIIFDGRSEDFAAEMFVIINSTPTRINKSHLIDLYEKVSFVEPEAWIASQVARLLYEEPDSPLRYRINRLGGRSRKEKWILQSELYAELHRWILRDSQLLPGRLHRSMHNVRYYYDIVRDFLKAVQAVLYEAWGNEHYMLTRSVTLRALIRVCADLATQDPDPAESRAERWVRRLVPWTSLLREFRSEGFSERFAARGQTERVDAIYRRLATIIGITPAASARAQKAR
ncbi:MAG: DGQHR domain-containing protein [Bacteroidota bacterium]|nr:DGQHR domain-containing protein [Candidatus Kapabacteria bacterium]MCS7303035.1 DGQHR domain-containing protein [Candidatus Kapabacteria bacterium]MCX7936632.1 DGQHR domain-containing protein [Chlorobiota bacterium]MDW8075362.1 DGQHR domain-containing protein [Bacteroidota bacterium]MDW8272147.1 DGQHR domain-containing protein [Bacteroidota bacterium]